MEKNKLTVDELRDIMENCGFSFECNWKEDGQVEYGYIVPCGHETSVYLAKDDVYGSLERAIDGFDINEYVYDGLDAKFRENDATVPDVYQLVEDGEAFLSALDEARAAVAALTARKSGTR